MIFTVGREESTSSAGADYYSHLEETLGGFFILREMGEEPERMKSNDLEKESTPKYFQTVAVFQTTFTQQFWT